jgi:hypothetical protein
MTKLPLELPSHLRDKSAQITGAYAAVLDLEQTSGHEIDRRKLMYARILGYLILEGPSDQARATVAREVASCANNEHMLDLGKAYFDHYIRACTPTAPCSCFLSRNNAENLSKKKVRKKGGVTGTPASSFHPSRRPFETTEEMTVGMAVEAPQDHRSAKNSVSPISCCGVAAAFANQIDFPGFGSGRFSLRRLWIL